MANICMLVVLAVTLISTRICTEASYQGHQLWRITPRNEQQLHSLHSLEDQFKLDFWKEPTRINLPVDIRVPPNQIKDIRNQLESMGLPDIQVPIDDLQKLIDEQERENKRFNKGKQRALNRIEDFDYTRYHPAEEVNEWIDTVASQFSNFTTKKQVGITYQGHPFYTLEFKKPSNDISKKPVIYVDSLIHCREWISTAALLFVFKEMLTNSSYGHLMDDVDWYFIPMINVDGYMETWTGDRLWRKTRSTGPSSVCVGSDANRNWDDHWGGDGSSPHPCSYTYSGPMAASESEVRHLQNYIMGNKNDIKSVVTVHSYSQLILYPYNYAANPCPDDEILNQTSKAMSDAMFAVHGKEYVWGPGGATLYLSAGVTTDWTYNVAEIALSYTFELRDTGTYGFLLPAEYIVPNGEELLRGLEVLANYVKEIPVEGSG